MSWWGQNPFDEIVEKATSELLPGGQEDLVLNLDISDQIRSKKINAKDAMRSFKRRLQHKNPNVQLATLSLVDTCVKNGGDIFVREIASREFMDELVAILKAPGGCNVDVRNKLTNIIQTWGLASKNKPVISYMYDTYALLKAEGVQFPPVNENIDAILLETAAAPEWSDSDVCDRCRTAFTMTNRKHHCRKCGGTFCQQCSAKTMPLPQLGINEHVRVCDGCYIKLKLDKASISGSTSIPLPKASINTNIVPNTSNSNSNNANNGSEEFDDDMKKAIELSLKEAEQQKTGYGQGYVQSLPAPAKQTETVLEEDPDLAAAIAASLRDMEISNNNHSSNQRSYADDSTSQYSATYTPEVNKDELSSVEMENILLFSTLMDRVYASGQIDNIAHDTQINQLYTQIGTLQPKLVKNLDETIRKRNTFIEIHEKLNMAVKAYDRLLEARISNIPEQRYQQQPLYHQQYYQSAPPTQNNYYSQYTSAPPAQNEYSAPPQQQQYSAPPQDKQQQYSAPPQDQHYQQQYVQYPPSTPAANNNQDTYHSAPPADPYYNQQQQQHDYYSAPPAVNGHYQQQPLEQKEPVEEAPLIDL